MDEWDLGNFYTLYVDRDTHFQFKLNDKTINSIK